MKFYTKFLFLICNLLTVNQLQAQSIFKGGIVAGLNAAQLDGDEAAGYHKVGLNAGVRATIDLGGRFEFLTEILYSQRGSRTTDIEASFFTRTCTLNYLEVPVLVNIRDWISTTESGEKYYKVHFSLGVSYGRLFSTNANDNFVNLLFPNSNAIDLFEKNDLSYMAGVGYFVNQHWGFSCRIAKSFGLLYDSKKYLNLPFGDLKGHYLTFQTVWIF